MRKTSCLLALFWIFFYSIQANVPQNVIELWKNYDPQTAPIKTEIIKEWESEPSKFKLIRYSVGELKGSNKTAQPMIAAYYALPKNSNHLPAIVHIHGGGQRASLSRVEYWASIGYAAISINWGGKVLEKKDTPNTDWNGLAAGFIGNKDQTHHNEVAPGPHTLYREPHPLNSSWMLIAMAARRAITFLEQQPEVDPNRIGVEGHSMGGRSTSFTAIDPRIKAASPSVGGSGYLYEDIWGLPGSSRRMQENVELYKNTISSQHYWKQVKCPTLFLGATNDFNSPTELVVRGLSQLPESTVRQLVLAPHLSHRFTDTEKSARIFWMESHLKGKLTFPKVSKADMVLDTADHIPLFKVWPEKSAGLNITKVEIYYGYARDPRIRFWRDAEAQKVDDHYEAQCPVFDTNEPLFAFANITYDTGNVIKMPRGSSDTSKFTLTSEYLMIYPDDLKTNNIIATEKPQLLIDDFSRDWHDWYRLSLDHNQNWMFATRKIVDPSWMGHPKAKLAFDLITDAEDNTALVILEQNTWQSYTGRERDAYFTVVHAPQKGVNHISLSLNDFRNEKGESLKTWNESTELCISQANNVQQKIQRREWNGKPPEMKNLRWDGPLPTKTLHPHEKRHGKMVHQANHFDSEFQKSIQDSIKLENLDEKLK